ncbi:MAG: hypothetical protein I4O49_19575 [Janthinobacterium lividum]|nr:hypothetical protein [Janthinobacterium lividum]
MKLSNRHVGMLIGGVIGLGAWSVVQLIAVSLDFSVWVRLIASAVATFIALRLLYDPVFDRYMLWSMRRIVRKYDQDRAAAEEVADRGPR